MEACKAGESSGLAHPESISGKGLPASDGLVDESAVPGVAG